MDFNAQLQAALADILSRASNGIEAGAHFLSAQLPDVVQQLLIWKLVSYLIPMVVAGLALIAVLIAGWKLYQKFLSDPRIAALAELERRTKAWLRADPGTEKCTEAKKAKNESEELVASLPDREPAYTVAGVVLGALAIVSGAIFIATLNLKWLQILIAPKIYLIEYAASLAK